jgi:hypothetical protein
VPVASKELDAAAEPGVSITCVWKWSSRFEAPGLDGLVDKSGQGRKPSLPAGKIEQVLTKVTQPPRGRRLRSVRTMAKAVVLCCDDKSQCQALERAQPGLPLGAGHIRTQTQITTAGTVTLFTALAIWALRSSPHRGEAHPKTSPFI